MSSPFPVTMLPYIPIHRPIHNVVESLLLTGLERQPMLQVVLPPSCQPRQKKLRKSGNDYAQSQPRVNQERLKKCSIGNLNSVETVGASNFHTASVKRHFHK